MMGHSREHMTEQDGERADREFAEALPDAGDAPRAPRRRGARATPPAASGALPAGAAGSTPTRGRKATGRAAPRERGARGAGERDRLLSEHHAFQLLPDALMTALPGIRHAILNLPLDDGLRAIVEGLATTLAPASAQIWMAEAAGAGEPPRIGGQQLAPALRARATARAAARPQPDLSPVSLAGALAAPDGADLTAGQFRPAPFTDALIEEAAATRHAVTLFDASEHPFGLAWRPLLPAAEADAPAPPLGTLAAYPLLARGRLLGVLGVGAAGQLHPRQLAVLEELADLAALAADRDQLLTYSRSQEALAQTVVRHAPVAMAALIGPEHIFALTNPAFALLLGLEGEADPRGRRLREVVPERAESLAASLRLSAVLVAGEPQAMIELPIHLDRGMTYWNVTTSPLPGASTSAGGVLIAAVDVTRQVLAKQRALESADIAQERIGQMMTLHATSLAVASQLGADPHELLADILRRSIMLLNARAGTVYARTPRQDELQVIVCQGLRGDYTGNRIRIGEGLAGQVARTRRGLIVDDYRVYPYRAAIYDDEAFSAVIAVPLIHHGQVVGLLDVLDDADRRTFTDEDLWLLDLFASQAAQALENARTYDELDRAYRKQRELDRMKDDFIATASHELRTPLTGVQGFLDLLLDYPGSRDDPRALDFLRKAADSAQELADIAERLLQTSRLDTGSAELHIGPVRLAPVVGEVLRAYEELQAAHGTVHHLDAEIPAGLSVQADLGRLKEVLDNLVGNAVKYSPHGGRISIRCGQSAFAGSARPFGDGAIAERPTMELPRHAGEYPPPDAGADLGAAESAGPMPAVVAAASVRRYFVITVTDEGMGIAPEERHQLFGRFARTEAARASQIRGTGLGLYICRQIARAMGGDVWLEESVPGRGSTFAFALPGASAPGTSAPGASAPGTSAYAREEAAVAGTERSLGYGE